MLETIIQIAVVAGMLLLWLFAMINNDRKLKQGEDYRNYLKTIHSGFALVLFKKSRLMAISFLNLITFIVYVLAVISSVMFVPQLIQTSNAWFITLGIVIVLSVLLHFYVRYFNKYLFSENNSSSSI